MLFLRRPEIVVIRLCQMGNTALKYATMAVKPYLAGMSLLEASSAAGQADVTRLLADPDIDVNYASSEVSPS